MNSVLCLTLQFLDPVPQFHGRGDDGNPEWPPSPLRLFQALVAASAGRWRDDQFREHPRPALQWLETIQPSIVAPPVSRESFGYRMYVPNNSGDLMTAAWARGDTETSMAKFRVEKDVRPARLCDGDAVHYLFELVDGACPHFEVLAAAARSITHLGWGVDMVAGDARMIDEAEATALTGERWLPTADTAERALRVPTSGTLDDLIRKHTAFLNRIDRDASGNESFRPVPPLTAFRMVPYRRATETPTPAFRAFNLLQLDGSGFRPFDTARKTIVVAGMMRHAAGDERIVRSLGWTPETAPGFIHGHGESRGQPHTAVAGPRLAYLPLPSIEARGNGPARTVGSIRRALLTVVGGERDRDLQHIARLLSSAPLTDERDGRDVAQLSLLPASDKMVRRYTDPATSWSTVTPVILPGYDDPRKLRRRLRGSPAAESSHMDSPEQKELLSKLNQRIEHLLRKAIRQAGYSDELALHAEIEWRNGGFLPGTDLATRYAFPEQLRRYRRLHVRITWRTATGSTIAVPGPICLGAGRFCGLGLFTSDLD